MKNTYSLTGFSLFFGVAVILLAAGCGSARRSEPLRGPLTLNEQLQRGQIVFMNNCHKCHPGGEAGVGPSINNVPLTKGILKFRVRSKAFLLGLGRMPSFKKHEISRQELNDLVRYIKVLKKHKEDLPTATL
ncbi:c-type cytochrome [Adhaeribacter aerolatus]|uniref:c-type cytochrome n=1 Tax=Adhaeribacter aerolatus TaxID=670289 RepID=UPI0011BDDFF6|nr:c-type cytochrome [Adhaeribacter aerolatus]